ncbi:MAG: hypothetical protein ACI8RD_011252 [Bacillariaceae sp.]|jgi:hypothetical protein
MYVSSPMVSIRDACAEVCLGAPPAPKYTSLEVHDDSVHSNYLIDTHATMSQSPRNDDV